MVERVTGSGNDTTPASSSAAPPSSSEYKLSPVDLESERRWTACSGAEEGVVFDTATAAGSRAIVGADDSRRPRIDAIRVFLRVFAYPGRRDELSEVDPRIVRALEAEFGVED